MKLRVKFALAALSVVALVFTGATTASASDLATTTIGSKYSAAVSLTWSSISPALPDDSRLTVLGRFTNHTANSVKLASFQICYQSGPQSSIVVSPLTQNASGNVWGGSSGSWVIRKGYCQDWYPNKVYYKQSDGEIVRVIARLGGSLALTAGFYR